jgi:hypothetical protein
MRKDDHLIFEALMNKLPGAGPDAALRNTGAGENAENAQQFTVVSGGVDNTSEDGIDINPADHIYAQSLKDAAEETLGEMQGDEDFDDTFPEEYREYVKDIFMMSNDSGDFIAVLPGHLNEEQIFNKLIDVRDNNSENAEHVPLTLGEPDPALKNTGPGENAENEPHGYPQGMTAIQNLVLNELKKKGFTLAKISHEDKERDKYPTVYMNKQSGPMHTVAEIDGMGSINGEHYKDYMANLEDGSEDAEGYNAMDHLAKAANQIRDILNANADDEAQTEHIIRMAQIILGPKSDHTDAEYRKMLDGLIVILNRFIIVPMN